MIDTIPAVSCTKCGALHPATADSFVVFHGIVTKGQEGGIVGNAGGKPTIYCARVPCLADIWKNITGVEYSAVRL
jgi:hypothetical protein